ncbi:haloalkane dehalogenase [Pontivivens ytuae]|uniref:Alpha/beta fold hydrolase n=1 Tax=Pontivivens ytuae TaxID=2789856 RepID=A0A7S9QDX3_9RHOB|nr:haloalkane dehalogenase [Pontivivens ytuae]QPH55340.1 alpha/beta fold hydrolase [Pontivivens ytuae]
MTHPEFGEIVRTPDAAFEALPGYPFAPHWAEVEGLRMHFVEEGAGDRVWLCLHGQPTWSYLYRRMIPVLVEAGQRVVAPDLIGFGKSDKPMDDAVYTFDFHRWMLLGFLAELQAKRITLVVQDWGGLLGLTLPMEDARIDRLLILNTTLATGEAPGEGFLAWRAFVAGNPDFSISRLMQRSCPHLTEAEAAAYNAPFPDAQYRAGVRRFPQLVPTTPEDAGVDVSRRAARFLSEDWRGRSWMTYGAQDPVFGAEVMEAMAATVRGCPPPVPRPEAGHFTQEWGEAIAREALVELG